MGFGPLPGAPDSSVVLIDGPWRHRTVRANGIALHVAEIGTGPLLLLLHGFPQFWWAWHQQLVDLADAVGVRVGAELLLRAGRVGEQLARLLLGQLVRRQVLGHVRPRQR